MCSDHRVVRSRISLYLRREQKKLVQKRPINNLAVRGKKAEFSISLWKRYSALPQEADLSVQAINDNLTSVITECAITVGGKIARRDTSKLSQGKKDLIKKRQIMKASNRKDRQELAKLSKLINRRKVADLRNYNMERISKERRKPESGEEETRHRQKSYVCAKRQGGQLRSQYG